MRGLSGLKLLPQEPFHEPGFHYGIRAIEAVAVGERGHGLLT